MRLGLTLSMLPQETLPSFVSHVAQKNGSRYVQDFVQDMGLSWSSILQLELEAVQDLADLTGVDPEELTSHSYKPLGSGFFGLMGNRLPVSFLDRSRLKFCPACCEDDIGHQGRTWGRPLWQLDSVNCCPMHGLLLHRLAIPCYPRSPHDFAGRMAEYGGIAALRRELGSQPSQFARYLSERIYENAHDIRCAWLDDLSIDVAARLCENVGVLLLKGPSVRSNTLDSMTLAEACGVGFSVCVKGRDELRNAYESVRCRSQSRNGGFYTDFGFFTRWLQRLTYPDRYRTVLDHFQNFVLASYPIAPGQMVLGRMCAERRWYSWNELGNEYGLTPGRISRFQRAIVVADDEHRRVAKGSYTKELEVLASGLDRVEASRKFGVHVSLIDRLVDADLLQYSLSLPGLGKLFRREDLDAFWNSVTFRAPLADNVPAGAFALQHIGRRAKVQSVELLHALAKGTFKKAFRLRGAKGFRAIHLDLNEVLDVFASRPVEGLSRKQVRKALHINCQTISVIFRKKMIESTRVRSPRSRKWMSIVAPEQLDWFLSRYLPLGLMAYDIGTQARHVSSRLERAGIQPIPLPPQCSKIYLREEVSPVIA
ncbi:TniQ family protein [Pseudogemmobacter blasticus]|uniref:TniQ domain-containing protein n=1 Tax=Fuscovulum blasticum DSM 2131 TaxID=1188250 RepID=A0A2T4J9G6_FUSBL|nr:TniQ family protein [Fuscovulum blasticum]PTE14503.1 hypothetical protein C5F44_08995 [Fuscovulum blasticum DSM 2131]